jgi:hypothetical protein
MIPNTQFRQASELRSGDVILCYCKSKLDPVARAIHRVTKSKYCHAAIYYGDGYVAESRVKHGLKKGGIGKEKIEKLLDRYAYVAVLRQPDAWATEDSVAALRLFIDKVIESGSKYNFAGVFDFGHRKELHEAEIRDKLEKFFSGNSAPAQAEKATYFCSEFVCDCFIAVGFIAPSAAVVFQSDTYSPGDIGAENAYGTFWGYLSNKCSAQTNEHDRFYWETTFDTLFGHEAGAA